jgi:hypothetical protein
MGHFKLVTPSYLVRVLTIMTMGKVFSEEKLYFLHAQM